MKFVYSTHVFIFVYFTSTKISQSALPQNRVKSSEYAYCQGLLQDALAANQLILMYMSPTKYSVSIVIFLNK